MDLLRNSLAETFGSARVGTNEPLAKHCNWRVGGPADLFVSVKNAHELIQTVRLAHKHGIPPTILGFGANVLVSDAGIRGLVILNRAQRISFQPNYLVEADSGTNLAVLAKQAAQLGVGGLEFLIGIPGTVGAAVAVNAGTRTRWISGLLESVRVLQNDGEVEWLSPKELSFSYRTSRLKQTGEVVIAAKLRGNPDEPANIERKMKKELQVRKNQPTGPSAGSVFKNPPNDFAGRLIEACGLKGFRIGGAQISEMHANFILNVGGAKAQDIKAIIGHAKSEVSKRLDITLEEEIRYLGQW
ncbi:UDP-N-acetylmuramate dehydrogenase [candidate division KSB1 bacterium]|nr:UDP-N-acetylmuramate dehydrogenase [candidate division KSB1 bacterium]NIS26962.1 UDP-N-acetylmuramate dehydrogenase [candidate division KSB1 bacterium]NIT73801.1 UDP-N-acetylmuramate dehydrogenase [candidate division KSB1 bacterium]NIU27706.1 UDP-N-acetylmuramate dehydrogenase [candidate division KSB1 bacterium]NIU92004.1 UDP-N-acetylmuramate dehydrogenase [candidate division KSB1 bacterium]